MAGGSEGRDPAGPARGRLCVNRIVCVHAVGRLPPLSGLPGQFLIKDIVLLGVSMWTLGD